MMYELYETIKEALQKLDLTPEQYEAIIKIIANVLGIQLRCGWR